MSSVDRPAAEPLEQVCDEDLLVRRARAGEVEAFNELYRRFHAKVFRYLVFRGAGPEVAADLAQDVFVAAWRAIPTFEPRHEGSVGAWLFTIARNLYVDHARRECRSFAIEDVPEGLSVAFEEGSVNRLQVVGLLETLPAAERDVLVLRFLVEMPREDVGRILGRTPDAVTQLQYRALERLRANRGAP